MAKEQLAVAELIMNLILGKTENVSRVDFFPQKKNFPEDLPYEQPFPRATPESQGVSSRLLSAMIRELYSSKYTDMHHLMVLRHGKVICECNFAPYPAGMWHITHSMCKSITSMAIGLLVNEGKLTLDENIYKIFEDQLNPFTKVLRPVITVDNLLTMTSGVTFNESGIVSGNDWLGSYLSSQVSGRPGTTFQYNSLNTYVLSAIVTKRTGETLTDYLKPRLFEPLGITRYLWETCPKGITKGGWGLFLCMEDMAKLGQLYLQKGMWNGQQIIPAAWVETSTQKHTDSIPGTFGYGYQIWMEQRPESFEFNGMLGQNVVVYPDMDMVLVTNAGNNELFQNCVMLNIIRKYFPVEYMPKEQLPEDPSAYGILQKLIGSIQTGGKAPAIHGGWPKSARISARYPGKPCTTNCQSDPYPMFKQLNGRTYQLSPQSVGLFPLFIQVFHNNMTEGLREISFSYEKGIFYVLFLEGDTIHQIPVGFSTARQTWLTIHEEPYLIATSGEFTSDENGTPVLKLTLTFLEECVSRKIHIFFQDRQIQIRFLETPGKGMIMEGLESVTEELANKLIFATFRDNGGMTVVHRLMEGTIEPVVQGTLCPQKSISSQEQPL